MIGHCKHGEFNLNEGCYLCIEERRAWEAGQSTGDTPPSVASTTAPPIAEVVIPIETPIALVKVNPEQDAQVMAFYNKALKLQGYAQARIITTTQDLKPATDDLSIIAKTKKGMEEKRKDYLKPFQDHIKEINDAFKTLMEPIENADQITRSKILAFQLKQKLTREEQERINALRLEAAQLEASRNGGVITESVNLVEVLPEAPRRISTDMGTVGTRDNWKWEVTDLKLVPIDYLMINAGMLTPIVKASKGKITIPGIRIYNEPIIAVNVR